MRSCITVSGLSLEHLTVPGHHGYQRALADAGCELVAALRKGTRGTAARRHPFGKHAPDCSAAAETRAVRLSSPSFLTRSARASSRTWRDRAATSRGFSILRVRWAANGWNCSRRLHHASRGSPSCITRRRRPMPRSTSSLSRLPQIRYRELRRSPRPFAIFPNSTPSSARTRVPRTVA